MSIFNFFKKNKANQGLDYVAFERWLDQTLSAEIPDDVVAFNFNIYEDGDFNWSVELIGASTFDEEDEDWACDEVFSNRDNPIVWQENAVWEEILTEVENVVRKYLEQGRFAQKLKQYKGIAVGFVDGNLTIL